jgi:hypothetical protein
MHHTKSFLPRTYGLSWDAKSFSLLFRIEKRMIPLIKKFLNMETPLIAELCKDYPVVPNFDSFAHAHQAFGFDNTFVYEREDEHELVYRFALKPVMYQSDETCTECDGTKISIFSNLPCRACRQTGKEYRPVENTYFTSGMRTYFLLSWFLSAQLLHEHVENLEPTIRRQIINIEISYTTGIHNCWIAGWAADEVFEWISHASDTMGEEIANVMFVLENFLYGYTKENNMSFRFILGDNNNFWLQVPGSAATLGSERGMNLYKTGRPLFPHNIDHRANQMYLIAGMTFMSDQVEKWMKTL